MAQLSLWSGTVLAEWLDYNGHMTEHRYLQVFGESSDALYAELGVNFERAVEGAYYTLETHIKHIAECRLGTPLHTVTEIIGYDEKRIHLLHRLYDDKETLLATGEHLVLHVAYSRACVASPEKLTILKKLYDQRRMELAPADVGSVLKKVLAHSRQKA